MKEKTTDLEHVQRIVEVPADVYGWNQMIKGALIAGIGYLPIKYHQFVLDYYTQSATASDPLVAFGFLFACGMGALVYGTYTIATGIKTMFNANEIRKK